MKKLGENVFQFPLNWGASGPLDLLVMFWPFLIMVFIMSEWIGLYHGMLAVLLGIVIFLVLDHKVDMDSKGSIYHRYDLVFHGKFGSRRVLMKNEDDWNLFQSLIADANAQAAG